MNFDGAGGWIRLSVDDTGGRGAVKAVYVKGSNTNNWALLTNTFGAAWETSSSPAPPLDFKFECDDGEEVTAQDVVKQNGGISGGIDSPVKFSTGAQFTINDPAAQQVKSMEGGSDPMLVTSSTPGNGGGSNPAPPSNAGSSPSPSSSSSPSTSPSQSSPSPEGDCTDVAPPGSYSCAQQKQFGKCNESFMTAGNFCASTCGRCSSGSSQQVKSFSGPTPSGGRKMMSKAFLQ